MTIKWSYGAHVVMYIKLSDTYTSLNRDSESDPFFNWPTHSLMIKNQRKKHMQIKRARGYGLSKQTLYVCKNKHIVTISSLDRTLTANSPPSTHVL